MRCCVWSQVLDKLGDVHIVEGLLTSLSRIMLRGGTPCFVVEELVLRRGASRFVEELFD